MSIWSDAAAVIAAEFADEDQVIYHGPVVDATIAAVIIDEAASPFDGPGASLRRKTYEIALDALPFDPANKQTLDHRGRRWRVENVTRRDDVGAWQLVVTDAGPLP